MSSAVRRPASTAPAAFHSSWNCWTGPDGSSDPPSASAHLCSRSPSSPPRKSLGSAIYPSSDTDISSTDTDTFTSWRSTMPATAFSVLSPGASWSSASVCFWQGGTVTVTAAIFDIGGVLELVGPPDFMDKWRRRRGLDVADFEVAIATVDPDGSAVTGGLDERQMRRQYADALGLLPDQADRFMADMWVWYCGELDEALVDYVRRLRPHLKTGILSNSADGARREEERHGSMSGRKRPCSSTTYRTTSRRQCASGCRRCFTNAPPTPSQRSSVSSRRATSDDQLAASARTSSITCRLPAAEGPSRSSARTISAFHRAQPRARAHMPAS